MKLPAFFGHKRSINLLPRDSFENSTLGIVLQWLLVFGKWSVILTQLVVMSAFLYRFSLDRTLTDLRKSIAKNVAVVKSYEQTERDYVLAQKKVEQAKLSMANQELMIKTIENIKSITPSEVWYDRINITPSTLSLNAYSTSIYGFGQLLTAIQRNPKYREINVGKIEGSKNKGAQVQFDLSVTLGEQK